MAADRLVPAEARPECDEHRRRELEQEADADRQPVDRDEVKPLHEREAADPVEDEERHLLSREPETTGSHDGEDESEADEAERRAELRQPQRRDPGGEDHLRDCAVHREQRCRRKRHRIAEPWMPLSCERRPWKGDLDHRPRLSWRFTLPAQ
jgi:hypothetical protein